MATDLLRRRLLGTLPAAAVLGALPRIARAAVPPPLLTCWADSAQQPRRFFAGRIDAPARALALPARGHDVFAHPAGDGSAIVVARRPGRFLMRWRLADGQLLARFDTDLADEDIRLEGHFASSADGRRLYATESELVLGEGRLGVYDGLTLARLASWPTGGIGPHAVKRLADGRLAVANGGILTLPETGRLKRNLDRMDPSLALIDPDGGRLLAQYRLPDPWMSIRHVAQAADGTLAVALQNEGDAARPLLARLERGTLRYGAADEHVLTACGGYAGDIAAIGAHFAVSCTTAGTTALWHTDGRFVSHFDSPRVCALAPHEGALIATGDGGDLWMAGAATDGSRSHRHFPLAFDNHAAAI